MKNDIIHAIVFVQNWGDVNKVVPVLQLNNHVISIFHLMGRHSYLVDVNFDNREQLNNWIDHMKSIELASGIPAVISLQTQKIIEIIKQKDDFSLKDYLDIKNNIHFFIQIDNPHHDDALIDILRNSNIVYSILHVQGECSFIVEIIVDQYDEYKQLLSEMKKLNTVHHIETMEVIEILKYRNQSIDESGNLTVPKDDIREIFSL